MVYSPYPLIATKRVTLELLRLEATSKSFLVIIDELDESFSSIRDGLSQAFLSNLSPLSWFCSLSFLARVYGRRPYVAGRRGVGGVSEE
jgi:hypothetical protein